MNELLEETLDRIGEYSGGFLIDGAWDRSSLSKKSRPTFNPSTSELIASVAVATDADIHRAVAAAVTAQSPWATQTLETRIETLEAFFAKIDTSMDLLIAVDAVNAGLPITGMVVDAAALREAMQQWPGIARSLRGEVMPSSSGLHYTDFSPYGVVARIVAYNHPLLFAVAGCIPALLAGNTVVLKAAEQAPMSALLLGDIIRQSLPPGLINIVTGDAATGNALVTHPLVRRIAFTGSAATGRKIQAAAARDCVRNVTLELGGKNAMIVLPDADPVVTAAQVVRAMNLRSNGGQSCGSTSRIFLHSDIAPTFRECLVDVLEGLRLGIAYETSTDMGPMISPEAKYRIEGFIREAAADGAELLSGGLDDHRIPQLGNFVAPTLFSNVNRQSPLAQQEIFGPVISLFEFTDTIEMLNDVNNVPYGLTASIWTNSLREGHQLARGVDSGYVWINDSASHYFGMPFGGWKDSGIGQEECLDQYRSFLRVKSVHLKTG